MKHESSRSIYPAGITSFALQIPLLLQHIRSVSPGELQWARRICAQRKSLQKLVALVQDYQVAEVVVTFSDRLTRFGLSYLTALFSGYGVTLTVLHPEEDTTLEEELTQDLLALIASFAGRLYGLRSRKQKALVDCAKQVLAEAAEES